MHCGYNHGTNAVLGENREASMLLPVGAMGLGEGIHLAPDSFPETHLASS